jgi:hypothetical protein
VARDKGFQKSEGMNQDQTMDNERGKTDSEDHGWAPDSGPSSEPNKEAGRKSFLTPEEQEAENNG